MTVKSAILLVGGMGTRMQPLTFATPKPMLKVAGIPFTEHQIVKAQEAGIEEIVLATSYMSEIFKPYFGNGERLGIKISYAVEESALGTGGAIRNAAEMLNGNGPVMIFNGDVMSSHSLEEQMQFHSSHNADVTLYLTRVPDARAFGSVELDSDDCILTFNEKMENPPTNIINAGCYIFNRNIIDSIPANTVVSVERETFPSLLSSDGRVFGFVDESYWLDIGNPGAFLQATRDLIQGSASSPAFSRAFDRREIFSDGENYAHGNSVVIEEPSTITEGSYLAQGVVVGPDARLFNCNVGENAVIGAKSSLSHCFIADNFEIPAGTIAENAFFGFPHPKNDR